MITLNITINTKKVHLITGIAVLHLAIFLFGCNGNQNKTPTIPQDDTASIGADSVIRTDSKPDSAILTVAGLFPAADKQGVTVTFYERQAGFILPASEKNFEAYRNLLAASLKSGTPVKFYGDIRGGIREIAAPTNQELREYKLLHENDIRDLVRPRDINVYKIDTSIFNQLELQDWPIFNICRTVVPSYAKAKEIFDTCARQSCHLAIPTAVNPCIPFQYVRDGCFARAHKMRYIIEQQFKYCSEKVFSYGINNSTTLAVRANKWGGCCVTWWYHVAPLIRVNVRLGKRRMTRTYVIDPGMFDAPVLLSAWLQIQANTTCLPGAGVGSYSIQHSSVYFPNGTTDPSYTLTNTHLANYNIPNTCP